MSAGVYTSSTLEKRSSSPFSKSSGTSWMTISSPRSKASAVRAAIHSRTSGWTIALSRRRAASSASMTVAPSSRSISATVDFPEPTPPVKPITFMELRLASMADEEKFDAVVVGAGPAGTAAAITMAKAGLQVALLERGQKPGSKNVMGGILYNHYLEEIVGDAWKEAPLERPIIEERRWMMNGDAYIGLDYKNLRNRAHPHSYSVLRAKFDPWFAEQAEKAGAMVVPETVVDRLIVKNNRVVGVATGRGDDLFANVVIVCEGIGLGAGLMEKTVI